MATFFYEAVQSDGRVVSGRHVASTVQEVEGWLLGQGRHPVLIRIEAAEGGRGEAQGLVTPGFWTRLHGIGINDKILFCRQMATMLGAGVTILQALQIMGRQVTNPVLSSLLLDVAERIEEGGRLSESFAFYPRLATPLFLNIIRVGEETGTLDRSFRYLAELFENEKEVSERIKSATRYPKIVITAIFGATFFLMSFVVPKFIALFRSSKVELPLPTKILIALSDFTSSYFWLILLLVTAGVIGYRWAMRYDSYRTLRDRLWLKLPIFGDLSLKIYLSRFCRVFSVLLKSGVNIISTLELSATALENLVLWGIVDKVTAEVREGVEMHEAIRRHPLFPDMIVQMVAIGEQSGQVDEMMDKVADYYEQETNYMIKNLSTLLEPILLLFLGLMVGFLALAIYMPMWNMMKVMKGG
jgi:type II secretory pathway component PulF